MRRLPAVVLAAVLLLGPATIATAQACVTLTDLARYPALRDLWQHAREAASLRADMMSRYQYTLWVREEGHAITPNGAGPTRKRVSPPIVNDPAFAYTANAIRRGQGLANGYYGPNDSWSAPGDLDVLHEDFLESHCFATDPEQRPGEAGLRFRPLRARTGLLDVRGVLWLDSATYRSRRLDLEFVDGGEARGTYRIDYADVLVAGRPVRMPVGGPYDLRPSATNPARHTVGTMTQSYSDFSEASAAPLTPEAADIFLVAEMSRRRIPGLSLAVVKAGNVIKAKGYGFANVDRREPVTPATVFRIASMSKQFISAGIMLLAQEGKLRIDDAVSKYLPATPPSWSSITLRHLLTHTSGVQREAPASWSKTQLPDSVVVQSAYAQPLLFPVGSAWTYSNTGYIALGDVIARASGTPWDVFLAQRVFTPLGMASTQPTSPGAARARGYTWQEKGLFHGAHYRIATNSPIVRPSGALYSTVLDLAKWDAALYRDDFLTPESRSAMWAPVRLNEGRTYRYGFGWSVDTIDGRRRLSHGGNVNGFSSVIVRFVDDSLTVIMLSNKDGESLDGLADQVARAFVPGLRAKPWH